MSVEVADPAGSPKNDTKRNVKVVLGKLGLDIIPVIVGILIALFINNAQENYRDRKLLESTMQSLSNEFAENAAEINEKLPLHKRWIDTLLRYKDNESQSISDLNAKLRSFSVPNIFTTNWQATLNSNSLGFLNFQTVKLLSEIDAEGQEMQKQIDMLYPVFFGPPAFKRGREGLEYRQGLESWLLTFIGNEEELLKLYGEFEQVVGSKEYIQKGGR